jgi:hypothetical protein
VNSSRLTLSLPYTLANVVGRVLAAARLPILRLDEETVCERATRGTGLTDFGDPHYREGLLELLESAKRDANLHPLGRFMTNDMVTNYLVQRLRLMEARKREPEIFGQPLVPPLIITGLARSGTTFLHRMLALDPAHQGIPYWLLVHPFPEKDENRDDVDRRIARTERVLRFRQPMLPGLDSIHYTRADSAEECILALGLTFNSVIFGTVLPVYGYMDWYMQQKDTLQKYREYRWLLQVYQSHEPGRRLTLKAPAHAGNLDALLHAVPEAIVVQTHRDPVPCVSSTCSLLYTFHLAMTYELDVRRMARMILRLFEVLGKRNVAFQEAHPGVVYHVMYDSLGSDPLGTVRGMYSHFDLPWTDAYASRLQEFVRSHPKDKHGKHQYGAADFGLTEDEIADRLQFFNEHLKRIGA